MRNHHTIVIVGGGNAGISVAAQLLRKSPSLQVAIIDPATKHYYQPAWTLVGAGVFNIEKTARDQKTVIPKKAHWIQQRVSAFHPENNEILLEDSQKITYDFLIVAPGMQLDWQLVKGLPESIGKNGVCSNYSFEYAPYTWQTLKNFKGGSAIFTNPHTPVKCGGAPHKIMYLATDYFKRQGILSKTNIQYWSGGSRLFGVDKYEKTLLKIVEKGNIQLHFKHKLEEIDGANKRARFSSFDPSMEGQSTWVNYDMIHVTPPQSAPDFIKNSPLANASGWVDCDKHTLQHPKYPNIFTIGDAAALPTAKTGAAIRKQAPVLVANLLSAMKNQPLSARYNGYSSCPLVTGYGKLVLAEFDYNNQPTETFPFDQSKERWSMYQLKKIILPWLYWNKILKGTV